MGTLILFWLGQFWRFRIDLTEENKYSLSPATEEVLDQITEPLHVDILLVGDDFPGGMRRLQKSLEETIRTFDAYSPERITFSYFDPLSVSGEEGQQLILDLNEYGINPTDLFVGQDAGQQVMRIFPGFLISDSEYETGALILKGEQGMSQEQVLNQSIENLEFELSLAIQKLIDPAANSIAMIIGHGEMSEDEGFGLVEALDGRNELFKVPLEQARSPDDLDNFSTIFIQGPRESYEPREIYLLDQYVMRGGNLVVLLDGVAVDIAAAGGEGTLAMPMELGLDNLLFRYGVRVNKDLIQDLNFGYFPVMGGNFGNQEQIVPLPWPFYVQAGRVQNHPITKGLDVINFRFVSSLDTVKADGVTKTPLIFSSDFARILPGPTRVAFRGMETAPDVNLFGEKNLPLAYLLEGEFTSLFKNRFVPDGFDKSEFLESGTGKVVVIGDGEIFQSQRSLSDGSPLALGEDPFNQVTFANRLLLRNLVQYLNDPEGIIMTRTRSFKIRPLNKVKVSEQKTFWQVTNVLGPVIFLLVFGLIVAALRKRNFSKKAA